MANKSIKTKEIKTKIVETKHPGGRPSDFSQVVLVKTQKYIDSCKDEEYRVVKSDGAQSTSYENKIRVNLPTIEGLALYLGIARDTVYEWEKEHKEFSDIIGVLRSQQANMLINNGLSGNYNPTIAKVLLSKHGYVEKQEVDNTHKGSVSFINDMPRPQK